MGLDIYFELREGKESSQVGYFRKVNFLVPFFDTVCSDQQLGNLKPVVINKNQVEDLINRCKLVLKDANTAPILLPTTEGFFFGSTDYDEYYFEDVSTVLTYCTDELLPMFDELKDNEEIIFNIWY